MDKKIVIGGSGFIGQAVQRQVQEKGLDKDFVFSYNKKAASIDAKLSKVHIDLLGETDVEIVEDFPAAIYVAGNADHALAKYSPSVDLDLNVKAFLHFMEKFRGSLILLSSQAVYYGLEGEVRENVDHVSSMPYGLSKQMTEAYAMHFHRIGMLQKLCVFRLMYAFGKGEKSRRLIPRCASAVKDNGEVTILGGGRSFVNPLPSWFVAKILVESVEHIRKKDDGFLELMNLSYPENVTVRDVVSFLDNLSHFDYSVSESGEEWPVRFWGNTENLRGHLKKYKSEAPNIWEELKKYFLELTGKVM